MATIFTKIVNGEIPCYKVAENEKFLAFLDISPLTEGHTLVIPKIEVDYIFDLDESLFLDLFAFARKVAKAIDSVIPSKKIGIAVIGLEVPHTHIHLVPQKELNTLNFKNPKLSLSAEKFQEIAKAISEKFDKQSN